MRAIGRGFVLGIGVLALAIPAAASAAGTGLNAYETRATAPALQALQANGFDIAEGRDGRMLEVVATAEQAAGLRKAGVELRLKRDQQGRTAEQALRADVAPDGSYDVYRPYWNDECTETTCYVGRDEGGNPRQTLYQEMVQLAEEHPDIVQPVEIGESVNGAPILALRVTRDAREQSNPPGAKPAVLYSAAQHAREWITPEMIRRLAHLFVDNYGLEGDALGTDGAPVAGADGPVQSEELTDLVNQYELWFVIVANPDGYDFTFTPGNRLWRKNLRDNDGNGEITVGDGVDLNRNFPRSGTTTTRDRTPTPPRHLPRPRARTPSPRPRRWTASSRDVDFEFMVNYHSAAELLLYPFGWQVQTTRGGRPDLPRAVRHRRRPGDRRAWLPARRTPTTRTSASELYTTNGETTDHAYARYDTLAWTPEMDVSDPERGGGESEFMFQDSDADLQDAFEKNIPFALDVAHSAGDPANPVSHLDRVAADFEVDRVPDLVRRPAAGRGRRQARARRRHDPLAGEQRRDRRAPPAAEFDGGERYGGDGDVYYHRVRGEVTGAEPPATPSGSGSRPAASARRRSTTRSPPTAGRRCWCSRPRTTRARSTSPEYPSADGPFYTSYYTSALTELGIAHDVYDFDAEGRRAPDPLGVLSHYHAVIWYTGDDLIVREPGAPGQSGVSRSANDMILAVRDFVNEGGKLIHTGQNAAVMATTPYVFNVQGQPPYCPPGGTAAANNCIPLSDDFLQYWLGAYKQLPVAGDPGAFDLALAGDPYGETTFDLNGPGSAANQETLSSLLVTSSVLPPDEYPQFESSRSVEIVGAPPAYDPASGELLRGRAVRRQRLAAVPQDDRPDEPDAGPGRGHLVQALLRHGAALRLRDRRGSHRRPGRLDDAARRERAHQHRHGRVVPDRLAHPAPVPRPLPDGGHAGRGVLEHRRRRRVERCDGQLGRLPGLDPRPLRLRGRAGRDLDLLRAGLRVLGPRRVPRRRRRHRGRHRDRDDRLRVGRRRLRGRTSASGLRGRHPARLGGARDARVRRRTRRRDRGHRLLGLRVRGHLRPGGAHPGPRQLALAPGHRAGTRSRSRPTR